MATEEDKTNTGIAGTAIAVGVAAMIAGSAALVSMARAEMDDLSQETQGYADLSSINALNAEQAKKLSAAKVSIDKARTSTLSALKGDPEQASPWTPRSASLSASSAAEVSAPPAGSDAAGSGEGASAAPATGSAQAPASGGEAPAEEPAKVEDEAQKKKPE